MARIFISYRRDDTAGHAGRFTDHLSRHYGEDEIFRDIEHIAPGRDFVQAIEQAVGSCDILIALIGRQWLTITDAQGRRRLDDPEDFVRLELTTALARNILVIPVLVQSARMPSPDDLPEDLAGLARRNALELRDTSWSSDVDRLVNVLDEALYAQGSLVTRPLVSEETSAPQQLQAAAPVAAEVAPARRAPLWRTCLLIGIPVVLLFCVAVGLLASNLRNRIFAGVAPMATAVVGISEDATVDESSAELDQPSSGGGSGAKSLTLPAGAEVTLDDATYTILSGQVDSAGTGELKLTLEIRLTTKTTASRNLWSGSTRLMVEGVPRAPTDAPSVTVDGMSALEGAFTFTVPDTVQKADLQLGEVGGETSIIPIDLTAVTTIAATPTRASSSSSANYPLALPAGTEVTVGDATYTILSAQVDRGGTGQLKLAFEIRLTTKTTASRNLWSGSTRLIVEGVPRAPTDAPSVTVDGMSALEGAFTFTIPDTVQKVDLQIGEVGGETTIVPIDLQAGTTVASTPTSGSPASTANYPLTLPAGAEVTVGDATYTILSAQVDRGGTGQLKLTFEIRLTTKTTASRNLWSGNTRLIVEGVPRAPTDAPSVTVDGMSAQEGAFVFTIPDTVQKVDLQIGEVGGETTVVPIDLTAGS